MDTRHMRYFLALAETLHFGQAAKRMNMTQPPFSRQITSIEKTLGSKLFDRNSRNVTLTPAGEHFLRDCRMVLSQFEAACRDVQLVARGMKGELRLGFMMHAANRLVPQLVRQYSVMRPDVRVILEERIPTEINDMLLEGTLDAAVSFGSRPSQHLRAVTLATDRLRMIAPVAHRLASAHALHPQDLYQEKIIAAPANVAPTLRDAITSYCSSEGIVPHFAYEPRLQHTIIQLVAQGLGIALIPESLTANLPSEVVSKTVVNSPEFEIVLCAPVATKNPTVGALFEVAAQSLQAHIGS